MSSPLASSRTERPTNTAANPDRFLELDSLRGLAALTVVFHHFYKALPASIFPCWRTFQDAVLQRDWLALSRIPTQTACMMDCTPLHIVTAGHEAVVLFFLLSGFVLSLPFYQDRQSKYSVFVIRRICRIYLPYLAAITFAIVSNAFVSLGGLADMNAWFNHTWRLPVRAADVFDHIAFLGQYDYGRFNTAIWSLVYEMRVSLLFPLLMLLVRWPLAASLVLMGALSLLGNVPIREGSSILFTLHYAAIFGFGALLAKHHARLGRIYAEMRNSAKALSIVAAFLLYIYGGLISFYRFRGLGDLLIAAGAAVFVLLCLHSETTRRFMALRPIHLLGRASYSLYLLHATFLFAFIYWMRPAVSWAVLFAFYVAASLVASQAFYLWVEVPAMQFGKWLGRRRAH